MEDGYDSVLLAMVLEKGRGLPAPGNDLDGVFIGLDLLRDIKAGNGVKVGNNVVVTGGGGEVCDVARAARRLRAQQVGMVCLEDKETMPVPSAQLKRAQEEGMKVFPSTAVKRIVGENGRVKGTECLKVKLMVFDKKGEVSLEIIANSEHVLEADTVIIAIGQAIDREFIDQNGIRLTETGCIEGDMETLEIGLKGVFVAGDAVLGPTCVAEALACGRRAAESIDKFLDGKGSFDEALVAPEKGRLPFLRGISTDDRSEMPLLSLEKRLTSFEETELGFDEDLAKIESKRCLWWDLSLPALL